jgi:hypothetical protein
MRPIFRRLQATVAAAAALGAAAPVAAAQSGAPQPPPRSTGLPNASIDDLVVSTAPALVLLGTEPTTVQRPTTPRGLKTTLLSAVGGDGGGIPDDFALEVTPYWLRSRPAFTIDDYFNPSFWLRVRRSASLAVASAKDELDDGGSLTRLAGSGRFLLVSPGAPPGYVATRRAVEAAIVTCTLRPAPADEACLDSLRTSAPVERLRGYVTRPRGLTVELAGGVSGAAPTEDAQGLRWQRLGVWLTPTYAVSSSLDAIVVGRYLRERSDGPGDDLSIFDYGGRLLWRPVRTFGISAEAVGRRYGGTRDANDEDDATVRYGALLEYAVSDQWYVFYSLGKDFAAADAPRSRLLARIGLNFGLGRSPLVSLP